MGVWHKLRSPLARELNRARTWGIAMKNKLLSGTACAALCLVSFSGAARSATLDDVMARLDKIEKENAELRQKVRSLSAAKPVAAAPAPVATDPSKFKGNPVLHAGVATSPAPAPGPTIGGIPVKAGPFGPGFA